MRERKCHCWMCTKEEHLIQECKGISSPLWSKYDIGKNGQWREVPEEWCFRCYRKHKKRLNDMGFKLPAADLGDRVV